MSGRFTGRRALITGASRGIGAAVARRLAAEGADVAIVARSAEPRLGAEGSLQEVAALLAGHGARVAVLPADLSDAADRDRLVPAATHELGGPIDILVNNAACAITTPVTAVPARKVQLQFEINVVTPLALIQAALPGMLDLGHGWIVNLTSAGASLLPGPPFTPNPVGSTMDVYGATKAALDRITNGLAAELQGSGVRVNAVKPRIAVLSQGLAERFADSLSSGSVESMEEMVEAVTALCACPEDVTGTVSVSLDLVRQWDLEVRALDGTSLPPGHPALTRP